MNTATVAFLINLGIIVRTIAWDLGGADRHDPSTPVNGYAWRQMLGYPVTITITRMRLDHNLMMDWDANVSYEALGRVKAATEINVVDHPYRRPKHQFRPTPTS